MLEAELITIANTQFYCLTRTQALAVGSRRQLDRLAKNGFLIRIWGSVYRVAGFPTSWHQLAWAVTNSIPGAAISYRTAATAWGLTKVEHYGLEITSPNTSFRGPKGVTLHRSNQLQPFVRMHNGLLTTAPARTIVDLSSCLWPKHLNIALNQMFELKLVTLAEVDHCLDLMVTRGRGRVSTLREILANLNVNDTKLESSLEKEVLGEIRAAGLPEPTAQHWVNANGTRYRFDFAYHDAKINIEADGPHHLLPSVVAYDKVRDFDVSMIGWLVIRVQVGTPPEEYIPRIRRALLSAESPSAPQRWSA